jgi:acetolactate synthase-1/2/3 large subunit
MTEEHSGASFIAATLKGYGVSHVFFVDAILRRTLIEMEQVGIARVLAHSEKAAAYMADGYARVRNAPAVCMAQSVGAANLAAGLQDAYLGRAPIVAMTGRKPPLFQHRNAYQELIHTPLFASVTKFSAAIDQPEQLPILMAQAFREATTGSPRPVHLDVNGLQGEIIETARVAVPLEIQPRFAHVPPLRALPDPDAIADAAKAIARSARPLIVCGAGAIQSGAHELVRRFAEALEIPVATSLGGRGVVATTHRLSLGAIGTYSAPYANRIAAEADLVVFVGCHTGDQVTTNWTVPKRTVPVVQIDNDPAELGRNYPDTIPVLADPSRALGALIAANIASKDGTWARRVQEARAAWLAEVADARRSDAAPIRVERLCAEIERALPHDAVLVADTGYSGIWTGTMIELGSTRQSYLRAAGSLGWSFPAALGAKCAAPERPVVCFCGDGAFYYHLPELETAVRRGIAIVVVVNNNSAFGQGLINVRRMQGNRPGNPDEIITFGPTDFAAIARAFGADAIRVERPAALGPALVQALSSRRLTVVDVVTDPIPRAPEAWMPT